MLKIENFEVMGWEHAIRGMRNPMNSWEQSDSEWGFYDDDVDMDIFNDPMAVHKYIGDELVAIYDLGPNDQKLMMNLRKAGTDHRKFMRMLTVYLDITAPLYWWKEFDTYKVGTVANSCSTMHKIHAKEFTFDDFSHEHLIADTQDGLIWGDNIPECVLKTIIHTLNQCRAKYIVAKTKPMKDVSKRAEVMKRYWWQMIQLLPSSYNQKRTIMLNYEVLANIYKSRRHHKLDEWHVLCDWIEKLPYAELITGEVEEEENNEH